MITDQVIEKKSRFVESLTHDSYVVQAERVTGKYQTRLEQLLSVFEQAHFTDERGILKDYPHDTRKEDELKLMVDILHHSGTDPETRKELEIEQEAWRSINAMFETREQELREEIQKREAKLSEKEEQLEKALRELEELRKKLKGN